MASIASRVRIAQPCAHSQHDSDDIGGADWSAERDLLGGRWKSLGSDRTDGNAADAARVVSDSASDSERRKQSGSKAADGRERERDLPAVSASLSGAAPAALGIYRHRETEREEIPEQPAKIARNKDVREYTEEERQRWRRAKEQENADKAKIARKWIAEKHTTKSGRAPAICQCGRAIKGDMMALYLNEDARIYNQHLQCRSWACPICAHKRAYARALELQASILAAAQKNYRQLFVTFTIPHKKTQKCRTVLKHLSDAYHRFRNDKALKSALREYGFVGQIKSLDFTLTDNGTHAHYHTIYIYDTAADPEELARDMYRVMFDAWDKAAKHETMQNISRRHGFDIEIIDIPQDDTEQAEALALYAAKVISIYSSSPDKDKGSVTPFDLLDDPNDLEKKSRFLDWYDGQKGVRRIVFSRGLKKHLNIVSDEYDRPEQIEIAYLSPCHTDFMRDPRNVQRAQELIDRSQIREAIEFITGWSDELYTVNRSFIEILEEDYSRPLRELILEEAERIEQSNAESDAD